MKLNDMYPIGMELKIRTEVGHETETIIGYEIYSDHTLLIFESGMKADVRCVPRLLR